MIKVQNNIATREPLPEFLQGLAPESLEDLSWTDPQLSVQDCAWWHEEDQSGPLPANADYGDETLEVDAERKVVIVRRTVVPWSAERIEQELASLRTAKNAEINAARLEANRTAFTHRGKSFACDELSRSDIDGTNGFVALYGQLPPGLVGGWKAIDNTYLPISTVEEWKAFYTAMFEAGAANFAKAQALKTKLASATTADEISAITWGMEV